MCMLSGPVLSENVARVKRPMVEAPFMIVRSQKVWSGLSFTPFVGAGPPTTLETLRVPKPRTAAHCTLLALVRYLPQIVTYLLEIEEDRVEAEEHEGDCGSEPTPCLV